jgi:D-serine dehydratase
MNDTTTQAQLATWLAAAKSGTDALIGQLRAGSETLWLNPMRKPFADVRNQLPLTYADIKDAAARLERFAAFFTVAFPETQEQGGIIESSLMRADHAAEPLAKWMGTPRPSHLLIKCDSQLPISGSIKARGGFYEVLLHAERLALEHGLLQAGDSYACFATPKFRELFAQHSISVGSTGNLGLSIGIISARLGFNVTVHMSADARGWKKNLLREKGVTVVEHQSDYSVAVTQGRNEANRTPRCHFIDDEDSTSLFLGYAVAALRLKQQLDALQISVNAEHPLIAYLPCGVGGGPGGIAFGLKHLFGDAVHCFFAEPTHSPCMLLGMYTGLHNAICVQDIGLDKQTCADGLAVGRASAFVGHMMEPLIDGIFTVEDDHLFAMLALIHDSEGLALEPSAAAGAPGFFRLHGARPRLNPDLADIDLLKDATHVIWATGGSMVPTEEFEAYYRKGLTLV